MQVVLVMFRADGERRSFSLPRTVTVIGRREDCDLRIPLGDVSRKHCRFIADNDVLKIEDLGSSNGTFHNGVRIQEAMINPGDTVQVGPVMFVVQINGVPADEEIQPPAAAPATSDDTHTPPADIEVDQLEEVSDDIPEAGEAPMEQLEDAAIAHLDAAEAEEGINVDTEEVEEITEELPEEDEADNRR
ncbi:MAG TPA: FHA domain-containing protein [Tepidisphaeraceae bacterium]|nr:FHA domain-containing protein [Tepidisphaeraceae bacterium]